MIKKMLLMAALLAPSLAYGANPTANLSVQIVPAGSAIPVGAQAAGFTTLAANYDFTKPMPANWLGCQPWDGQKHLWYQITDVTHNNGVDTSGSIPCEIAQTTDPQNPGQTALAIPWKSSYRPSPGFPFTNPFISTMSPDFESSNAPNNMVGPPTFPDAYFEYEFRVQSSAPRNNPPFVLPGADIAAWMVFAGAGNEFNGYEGDTFEIFDSNNPNAQPTSTIHTWGDGDANARQYFQAPSNYDVRQYHKWAMRRTSDGTNTSFCTYLDGAFQTCANYNSAAGAEATKKWGLMLDVGMLCNFKQLDTSCYPPAPFSLIMYVKTARVWSCTNWQTTMCNGSALTGAP
jgi:hypothetical protein